MDDHSTLDALIDLAGPLLGVTVQPDWRPAIRTHLALSLDHARAVAAFALDDEAEPAPVYTA